jgi:hypothetical protein
LKWQHSAYKGALHLLKIFIDATELILKYIYSQKLLKYIFT